MRAYLWFHHPEIDKLQLTVKHQAEMLAQKERELAALQEIIRLMGGRSV